MFTILLTDAMWLCPYRYIVAAGAVAALATTLMGSLLPQVF